MGKIGLFEIKFKNDIDVFYPGQTIKGEVQINICEEIHIKEITIESIGYADVKWTESRGIGSSSSVRSYTSGETYFSLFLSCKTPPSGQDKISLQPGSYKYPFYFKLPNGVPASFKGDRGCVSYFVAATIKRPWSFDKDVTRSFTVPSVLNIKTLPKVVKPCHATNSKSLCCLCCTSGPITGKLKLNRRGFSPGDSIPFIAECTNHSNRNVTMTSIQLRQTVLYKASGKVHPVSVVIRKVNRHVIVPRGDSDVWNGDDIIIPNIPASGLKGCSIIDLYYTLHYVCQRSRPSLDLEVYLGIVIGGSPLKIDIS